MSRLFVTCVLLCALAASAYAYTCENFMQPCFYDPCTSDADCDFGQPDTVNRCQTNGHCLTMVSRDPTRTQEARDAILALGHQTIRLERHFQWRVAML